MSQERMDSTGESQSRPATSYTSPDIGDTMNRVNSTMRKCRVVHGANEGYFEIEGKNVGQVRKSLRDVFSIPSDAVALIDGKTVQDDFIMAAGQQLEFNKEAGTKGINRRGFLTTSSAMAGCMIAADPASLLRMLRDFDPLTAESAQLVAAEIYPKANDDWPEDVQGDNFYFEDGPYCGYSISNLRPACITKSWSDIVEKIKTVGEFRRTLTSTYDRVMACEKRLVGSMKKKAETSPTNNQRVKRGVFYSHLGLVRVAMGYNNLVDGVS